MKFQGISTSSICKVSVLTQVLLGTNIEWYCFCFLPFYFQWSNSVFSTLSTAGLGCIQLEREMFFLTQIPRTN